MKDYVNIQPKTQNTSTTTKVEWYRSNGFMSLLIVTSLVVGVLGCTW